MKTRAYLAVSGTVFGIVAVLHLLRIVNGWAVMVGPWSVPVEVSWVGAFVPAGLCVWALGTASRS